MKPKSSDAGGRPARSALLELIAEWRKKEPAGVLTELGLCAERQRQRCADELEDALEAAGLAAEPKAPARSALLELMDRLRSIAHDYRREAELWPKNERAQQVARMLRSHADILDAQVDAAGLAAEPKAPARSALLERLDAHIGIMEEHLDNEEFCRKLHGGEISDDETPMPHVRVFQDEIKALRALYIELEAAGLAATDTPPARSALLSLVQQLAKLKRLDGDGKKPAESVWSTVRWRQNWRDETDTFARLALQCANEVEQVAAGLAAGDRPAPQEPELEKRVRAYVAHCPACGGAGEIDVWDHDPRTGPYRAMMQPCAYCSELRDALALPVSSPAPAKPTVKNVGCHQCGRDFQHEPVTQSVGGVPARTYFFCTPLCRTAWTDGHFHPAVAAPVLSEPPPTITTGTAQPVSLQADLSLPAVLGTLPRYTADEIGDRHDGDKEFYDVEDVAPDRVRPPARDRAVESRAMNPPQYRVFPAAELHLVSNPLLPAYTRYYDFVGLVTEPAGDATAVVWLSVCVSGVVDQRDGQRWAFRRKRAAEPVIL